MDFNADNNDHGEHGNHVVGHRSHLQPVPLLLGRQYDTMEDARLSIKQFQDSGLPYATKFANKIRFCFVCPKIRSNTTQQCDFIVRPVLRIFSSSAVVGRGSGVFMLLYKFLRSYIRTAIF
jgi:hypothetical protein